MATGHINPGYDSIVSRFKTALENPSGARNPPILNQTELADIRARSRSAWAARDTSETTYVHFFREPAIKEKAPLRPTSPTRRNNPHPDITFQATHLKELPGYFDPDAPSRNEDCVSQLESKNYPYRPLANCLPRTPSVQHRPVVSIYPSASHYIESLPFEVAGNEEANLQKHGVNTKNRPVYSQSNQNNVRHLMSRSSANKRPSYVHNKENQENVTYVNANNNSKQSTPLAVASNSWSKLHPLQSNLLNPYLYEDYRVYREKYETGDHGMSNPNAKKPHRGDFMMHPDWHPYLYQHRLPYYH